MLGNMVVCTYSYLYFTFTDNEVMFIVDKHPLKSITLPSYYTLHQEYYCKPSCKTLTSNIFLKEFKPIEI